MTTRRIDLKDAAAFFGNEWRKEYRDAALLGLLSAAQRGVQTIQAVIIPSRNPPPVDRGLYRAGWHAEATSDGAQIFNDNPIAPIIEDGVRASRVKPGAAMVAALTSWVMRKGLESDSKKAKGVAFAIIQRMKQRGIFNQNSTGLGILRELEEKYIDSFAKEEVEREIRRKLG